MRRSLCKNIYCQVSGKHYFSLWNAAHGVCVEFLHFFQLQIQVSNAPKHNSGSNNNLYDLWSYLLWSFYLLVLITLGYIQVVYLPFLHGHICHPDFRVYLSPSFISVVLSSVFLKLFHSSYLYFNLNNPATRLLSTYIFYYLFIIFLTLSISSREVDSRTNAYFNIECTF